MANHRWPHRRRRYRQPLFTAAEWFVIAAVLANLGLLAVLTYAHGARWLISR